MYIMYIMYIIYPRGVTDEIPTTEARAQLSELINRVAVQPTMPVTDPLLGDSGSEGHRASGAFDV